MVSSGYRGGEMSPIVDTWWQTETGGIMITPLPGCVPAKPAAPLCRFRGGRGRVIRRGQGS